MDLAEYIVFQECDEFLAGQTVGGMWIHKLNQCYQIIQILYDLLTTSKPPIGVHIGRMVKG